MILLIQDALRKTAGPTMAASATPPELRVAYPIRKVIDPFFVKIIRIQCKNQAQIIRTNDALEWTKLSNIYRKLNIYRDIIKISLLFLNRVFINQLILKLKKKYKNSNKNYYRI